MQQIDYKSREDLRTAISMVIKNSTEFQSVEYRTKVTEERILTAMQTGDITKIIRAFKNFTNTYYYMVCRGVVMDVEDNYYFTDTEQLANKYIFIVGEEQISLFDLYNISDATIIKNLEYFNFGQTLIFKMVYSHFINKHDYITAEAVYKLMISVYADRVNTNDNKERFPIISHVSNDYIPFLTYADKAGLIDKSMIARYLKAIYNKELYIKNEFDRVFYNKMQAKYSDFFRLSNVSSYLIDDKDGLVNNFDLVDSDSVVRERVFRVFDGESGKILKAMLDEDFERTHKMLINFLNIQYYKGKKQKQFISTYSRLKDILERRGHKLDVFQLNDDLQSHIVLDILN